MRRSLQVILFLMISCPAWAGKIDFVAKASSTVVEAGQRFQVTYTVNSGRGNFTPPPFTHFESNRFAGQSSSTQIVNGNMTQTYSLNYVLATNSIGTFEIAPAKYEINGESYESNSLTIEVVKGNSNSANAQRNRQSNRKQGGKDLKDYIYLDVILDKKEAYVGEKITATFKMYTQLPVSRVNPEKLPDLKGFWSENITDYNNMRLSQVNKGGTVWQVADVQQIVLFPQRSGDLVLDPLEIQTIVQVRTRRARSIWEEMMGGGYENKEVIIKSPEVKLKIKPLPLKGKPAEFSGAVGQFNMKLTTSKTNVKANEAIDLKIKISGQGNLGLISAPELNFPPDFESYDPETSSNIKTTAAGTSGSKTFTYLIIPRHSGTFELEPYTFTYFDPQSKTYKSLSHAPVTIEVEKSEQGETVVYTPQQKEEVALLNTDIRYIHSQNVELIKKDERFYGSIAFYLILGFCTLGLFFLYLLSKRLKSTAKDVVGNRKAKANKVAKKRLSLAKKHLDSNDTASFYQEIANALFGYYADKFNISQADLSQERILEEINDEEIQKDVKATLDEVEMARYAPAAAMQPHMLYEKTMVLISKSENL